MKGRDTPRLAPLGPRSRANEFPGLAPAARRAKTPLVTKHRQPGAPLRVVVALAILVGGLAACGGRAIGVDNPDGSVTGGRDGGAPDGYATCAPRPGCASTTWCNDGCNECGCDSQTGAWACTKRICDAPRPPPPPPCPPGSPPEGASCPVEGQTCGAFEKCAPRCVCKGARWSCDENPCGLACPTPPPVNREACDERGHVCVYRGGCPITCTCDALTPDVIAWRCISPPC